MDEQELKRQLSFIPKLEGNLSRTEIKEFDNVIVCGMGGSALAARILFFLDPTFPVWLHDDYGLPAKNEGKVLYIAISYSGNTAETLSFVKEALKKKYSLIIITSGGVLLDLAIKNKILHILIPSGFVPRNAVLYMLRALLYVINRENLFLESDARLFDFSKASEHGLEFGKKFENKIPLIYASRENQALAYIWKIVLNETGKIPAFVNYFPELAHNEIQGLVSETAGSVAEHLKVLLLLDREDSNELSRVMTVFQSTASAYGVEVFSLDLPEGKTNKLLYVLSVASATAQVVARSHGVDANSAPFIEKLKTLL
ncbi:MAG: SIS domain-containing protein [Patescibacteria group bacterium]